MRQAGRYLPEYRQLREKHAMLDLARNPDLAAQVTLQPLAAFELDAAILFSDIMIPVAGIGVPFRIEENVGPVVDRPIRSESQIRALRSLEPARDVPFVLDTIRIVRRELAGRNPLIGFSGAPFTLASYLIEGRSPRQFRWTKTLMLGRGDLWDALLGHLTDTVIAYLRAQAEAGAQALQLFDSWAGNLQPDHYARYVQPHSRRLFRELAGLGVPLIHFGTDTATLLPLMAEAGGDVIGVDWRIPLGEAWARIGRERGIMGNLDPGVLFADVEVVEREAAAVLAGAAGLPGHIFNLGHGVLPHTPVDTVRRLVEFVHVESARRRG